MHAGGPANSNTSMQVGRVLAGHGYTGTLVRWSLVRWDAQEDVVTLDVVSPAFRHLNCFAQKVLSTLGYALRARIPGLAQTVDGGARLFVIGKAASVEER
jgi:hypothetical protein